MVEQLICNQQVAGSSPITSSKQGHNPCPSYMGEFPSGQRGQTVNLLLLASMVRIHPLPPRRSKVRFAPFFFTEKHPPASLLLLFRKKNYEVLRESNSTFWIVSIKKKYDCALSADSIFCKKARSAHLFAYKCTHNGSLSLPPFCDYAPAAHFIP